MLPEKWGPAVRRVGGVALERYHERGRTQVLQPSAKPGRRDERVLELLLLLLAGRRWVEAGRRQDPRGLSGRRLIHAVILVPGGSSGGPQVRVGSGPSPVAAAGLGGRGSEQRGGSWAAIARGTGSVGWGDPRLALARPGHGEIERRGRIGREGAGDTPNVVRMMIPIVQVETQRTERDAAGGVHRAAALTAGAEREPVGEGGGGEPRAEDLLLVVAVGRHLLRMHVVETEHLSVMVVRIEVLVMEMVMAVMEVEMPEVSAHPQTRKGRANDTLLLLLGLLQLAAGRRIF